MAQFAGAITRRSYRGDADRDRMLALVRGFPAGHVHVVDLPYRLASWAFDHPANVSLWEDETGSLVAWAALQTPFWTLDYACHPAHSAKILPAILRWADEAACAVLDTLAGRPSWFVNVFESNADHISALAAAGYACQVEAEEPWYDVLLARPANAGVPDCLLPPGFSIRPLAGVDEAPAYVGLHRAVFETKNMTEEWRRRIIRCPEYARDLDLVAVDAEGALAGFCVLWFEPAGPGHGPRSQVEPMGVTERHRGAGLGKALLAEGVRRTLARGATEVLVQTDNYRADALGLYGSLGFVRRERVLIYRKDIGNEVR